MDKIRVKYIGEDLPLSLRTGKVYEAYVGYGGLYGIVDETGEEYGYPPCNFEIVSESVDNRLSKPACGS